MSSERCLTAHEPTEAMVDAGEDAIGVLADEWGDLGDTPMMTIARAVYCAMERARCEKDSDT